MKKETIIGFSALGVGVVSTAIARSEWERKNFVLQSYTICDYKICSPFRLAFLSDLHGAQFGPDNEELIQSILDARPDALLIGGDMMITKPGRNKNLSSLEKIIIRLKDHMPIFYAEGNHEQRMRICADEYPGWWKDFKALLKYYNIPYLCDKSVQLREDILVSGLYIETKYYTKIIQRNMPESYVKKHLPEYKDHSDLRFRILLAHAPQFMESYWLGGADLVLSGHFHGGVMVLPVFGPVVSPQFNVFPKYARGLYVNEATHKNGIVSAGLGTHSVNVRLFNRPELVVVDLLPKE